MLIGLLTAVAVAGGGGVFVELDPAVSLTDATDVVARGWSGAFEIGSYAGPYRGTMRYGRYTRAGFRLSWTGVELDRDGDLAHQLQPMVTFGKGTDVVDIGGFWTVAAGPVAVVDLKLGRVDYGGGGRLAGGAIYDVGRSFGFGLRVEGGADLLYRVDEGRVDVALTGTAGLFFLFRAPLWTPKDDYETAEP